jgi:hypothetical protein
MMARLILLIFFGGWLSVTSFAQDGNQLMIRYNVENNAWKLDDHERVSTSVTYPEIIYHWGLDYGGLDMYFSGIFSGLSGNSYTLSSDDSLQITRSVILGFSFYNYPWRYDEERHNIGYTLGFDVLGHMLVTGAEEGSMNAINNMPGDAREIADLRGLSLSLGPAYQFNYEDRIVVDALLNYHFIYNSALAPRNEKTFSGRGWQFRSHAKYYPTYRWVFGLHLDYSRLGHDPIDVNNPDYTNGTFSSFQLGISVGMQW